MFKELVAVCFAIEVTCQLDACGIIVVVVEEHEKGGGNYWLS